MHRWDDALEAAAAAVASSCVAAVEVCFASTADRRAWLAVDSKRCWHDDGLVAAVAVSLVFVVR